MATAGVAAVADTEDRPAKTDAAPAAGKKGYHVTPHIEKYYRLARQ